MEVSTIVGICPMKSLLSVIQEWLCLKINFHQRIRKTIRWIDTKCHIGSKSIQNEKYKIWKPYYLAFASKSKQFNLIICYCSFFVLQDFYITLAHLKSYWFIFQSYIEIFLLHWQIYTVIDLYQKEKYIYIFNSVKNNYIHR